MLWCENCLQRVWTPLKVRESHGFSDGRYEETDGCPYCKAAGTVVMRDDTL